MKGERYLVETEEDLVVDYPDKAETVASGPCLVIGILNTKKRRGYLAHYADARMHEAETFIDEAVGEAKKLGDLEIVLAGNRRDEDDFFDDNFDHGQWVAGILKSKGIKYDDKMIYGKELGYNVVVDTETRSIILEELE